MGACASSACPRFQAELFDGPLDPLQGLQEKGAQTAEVDPDEALELAAEGRAVTEINMGLLQKEVVERGGIEAEAPTVEEGEICPFGADELDSGNPLVEEFLHEIDVRLEVRQELFQPILALGVGGLETDDPGDLAELEPSPLRLVFEHLEEARVGGDDGGRRKAGDIE